MRANRLLNMLMTLQARGRATAPELAREGGTSLRTVYRDIESLSALGIPVYSERGAGGGYRLLDGYRMRLNGLSSREAEALFMTGLSGPARDLGLGAEMAMAELKLLTALPASLRAEAERIRATFHLDAPSWFNDAEQPECLPTVASAVWEQQVLRIRYQSWKGQRKRRVEPLGLVLKGGAWYLAGRVEDSIRNYRVSRILELEVLEETFERPDAFDLGAYWEKSMRRFHEEWHHRRATVRLSPAGAKLWQVLSAPYLLSQTRIEPEPDESGWHRATLPIGPPHEAHIELLRLGAEVEVLEPEALREQMAATAADMTELYQSSDLSAECRGRINRNRINTKA